MTLKLIGERLAIRELQRADLPFVLEVYNSNPGYNLLRHNVSTMTLSELEAEYDSTLAIPQGYWLLLAVEGTPVGVMHVVLASDSEPKSWISLLVLHASWQKKGLGKEAVKLFESFCAVHGTRHIHHGVIAHNESALRFWGRLDYEQYRQVEAPVGLLTQPVLLVAKWLDSPSEP